MAAADKELAKSVHILIADDHEIVRQGLRAILQTKRGCVVCGEAATGPEAIEKARELKPDIVLLDINMPELPGAEVARQIRKLLPKTEVLALTMDESPQTMHEVLRAGARGYVFKSDLGTYIAEAVEALSQHKHYFTSRVAEVMYQTYLNLSLGEQGPPGPLGSLTDRQREVVRLLAEGKSNKEVAMLLNISTKTAETHRHQIMRKLGMHSFSDLVRYAVREGIVNG